MWVNVVFPIRPGRMQGEGGKLNGRIALKIAANIKIIYLVCKVLAIENKTMTKLSHTNLKLLPLSKF